MAIKGKAKPKSRRPPARAPRREPVVVKPPLFLRRWVQVVLAFVVGILAVMLLVWVTNGLRDQRDEQRTSDEAASKRRAVLEWQTAVEGELGKLGTLSPGAAPVVLAPLSAAIDGLKKGDVPKGAVDAIETSAAQAKTAWEALQTFDLPSTIRDKGFNVTQTNYLLNSQTKMVESLQLFEQAALVAKDAAVANGPGVESLGKRAGSLQELARQLLNDGWNDYQQALFSAGVTPQGLGGGS
jgi:hypothetical protein